MLEYVLLLAIRQVVPAQQHLCQQIVFCIEEGRRDPQHLGQALGRPELGFVLAAFVLIDSGARHGGVQSGEHTDLRGILRARKISQATVANMKQNLTFAFLYNALGVPVAAGVLYPAFGILLSPMVAALAMSLSSVSVVANALRLAKSTAVPATPKGTAPDQTPGLARG